MFAIVTDTSANLDCSLLQQRNIAAIPFTFFVGGQEQTCTDTAGFDGPAFYSAMRSGTQVKTSQVSPQQYIDLFSPMLAMGQEILFVGMSSGISGSYHSAEIAAQQLKEVFPDARIRLVDTLSASLGEGLVVIETARLAKEGGSLGELEDFAKSRCARMQQFFVVDDLKYLHKGGRISGGARLAGTLLQVIFASMAAYVLEKHHFYGKNVFFGLVTLTLMFSPTVTTIPNFIIMSNLGLIDTYSALIIPTIGSSMGVFLMKQFMGNVHDAILEAAKIDGAGEVRIFFRIVMPSVKSAWLTLIIFAVQSLWNSTGGVVIRSEELKPLSYALSQIAAGGIARAGASAAVSVVMMIVPIVIFIITQSNILDTMATSGIKE